MAAGAGDRAARVGEQQYVPSTGASRTDATRGSRGGLASCKRPEKLALEGIAEMTWSCCTSPPGWRTKVVPPALTRCAVPRDRLISAVAGRANRDVGCSGELAAGCTQAPARPTRSAGSTSTNGTESRTRPVAGQAFSRPPPLLGQLAVQPQLMPRHRRAHLGIVPPCRSWVPQVVRVASATVNTSRAGRRRRGESRVNSSDNAPIA